MSSSTVQVSSKQSIGCGLFSMCHEHWITYICSCTQVKTHHYMYTALNNVAYASALLEGRGKSNKNTPVKYVIQPADPRCHWSKFTSRQARTNQSRCVPPHTKRGVACAWKFKRVRARPVSLKQKHQSTCSPSCWPARSSLAVRTSGTFEFRV